jgi:hypothetical protein
LHRVVEVALHHREREAYRQVAGAAFHQLAEVVALHREAVVFWDQAAAQLQN